MDILGHITELREQRGWSVNELATRADVPQSTLAGQYGRGNTPTIPTLEKLCGAFGITLSEFFAPPGGLTALTEEQRVLLAKWQVLPPQAKAAVLALMEKL